MNHAWEISLLTFLFTTQAFGGLVEDLRSPQPDVRLRAAVFLAYEIPTDPVLNGLIAASDYPATDEPSREAQRIAGNVLAYHGRDNIRVAEFFLEMGLLTDKDEIEGHQVIRDLANVYWKLAGDSVRKHVRTKLYSVLENDPAGSLEVSLYLQALSEGMEPDEAQTMLDFLVQQYPFDFKKVYWKQPDRTLLVTDLLVLGARNTRLNQDARQILKSKKGTRTTHKWTPTVAPLRCWDMTRSERRKISPYCEPPFPNSKVIRYLKTK
ncbi:MAG: hypothetical protein R3B54_11330 [Bdellovibrionota bacterium]